MKTIETSPSHACYTSVQVEHEQIICVKMPLREDILSAANMSSRFSIIADETADIPGNEQLLLGVHFICF
ncbi:hypothetical protein E2320_010315 [Naja naja]|nr:hypothetical protein E2320_010315 [Naja naja]